jgi:hypothetical protein
VTPPGSSRLLQATLGNRNAAYSQQKEAELASIIWQVRIVLAMEESKPSTKKDELLAGIPYLISQSVALALLLDAVALDA